MSITSKTITLTGEETAVKFDKQYPYFWVQNLGKSDVYMSVKPGIVPDSDGVKLVPAGGGKSSGEVHPVNTLYLLGSGKVEVSPQFNAFCPFFKPAGKGGDSDLLLSGFAYSSAVVLDEILSTNKLYEEASA